MPPRSLWKGAITFGLVNVPVAMVTATRSHDIRMHLVHDKDGSRLRQQRICAADGEVVEWEHVERGFELSDGRFVRITDAELESLAAAKSRAMEIEDVVPLDQIDPMYVEKSWHLIPTEGGARGYALLASALAGTGRAAIARLTMRGRQQLVSIRSTGETLVVESLRYADEVVRAEDVLETEALVEPRPREVEMTREFLAALEVDFDPSRYVDDYQRELSALIERKAQDGDVVVPPEPADVPDATPVNDILAALEASLKARRAATDEDRPPAKRRAAAATRGAASTTAKARPAGAAKAKKATPKATAKAKAKSK